MKAIGGAGLALAAAAVAGMLFVSACARRTEATMNAAEKAASIGKPSVSGRYEKATFAAGCFWGVQAAFDELPGGVEDAFRRVEGVTGTVVGYTGGTLANPTYADVCSHITGHAEAVEVTYDPARVTYAQLLDIFWKCHDPTTRDRQGPDVGSQYRSAIFYHTPQQATVARAAKERLEKSGRFQRPIVTEIVPAGMFYRAEEYHQQYHEKHGGACRVF